MDGCHKESQGRGLCSTHWLRWRKHGDPAIVKRSGVDYNRATTCVLCDRRAHAKGLCSKHLARFERWGDPFYVAPREGRPIKGAAPSWDAVHKRLSRQRGPAAAREWSYDGQDEPLIDERLRLRYSLNLDRYEPRCVRCHRRFDRGLVAP